MKKILFILMASMMLIPLTAHADDDITGVKDGQVVIFSGGQPHKLIDARYYCETQMLIIEFETTDFEPYTLSVSSMYATLDHYVTTPFVCLPIYVTDITIELELETGGNIYWGSFVASSNTSME